MVINKKIEKYAKAATEEKIVKDFSNILCRIPNELLQKVDECVKHKPWLTRTSWINEAIQTSLEMKQ